MWLLVRNLKEHERYLEESQGLALFSCCILKWRLQCWREGKHQTGCSSVFWEGHRKSKYRPTGNDYYSESAQKRIDESWVRNAIGSPARREFAGTEVVHRVSPEWTTRAVAAVLSAYQIERVSNRDASVLHQPGRGSISIVTNPIQSNIIIIIVFLFFQI